MIDIDPDEKLQLFSEVGRVCNQYIEPMKKWLNNPNVPQEQKAAYGKNQICMMTSVSFLAELMLRCGFSDEDIYESLNLPF
jgi:hypothetical protein